MTVYVDPLMDRGWVLNGQQVRSCHLFTDQVDLQELHRLARMIGCRPGWFQDKSLPHYDLTGLRRQEAIGCGAEQVTSREAVEIWKRRRETIAAIVTARPAMPCATCPSHTYCHRLAWCGRQRV